MKRVNNEDVVPLLLSAPHAAPCGGQYAGAPASFFDQPVVVPQTGCRTRAPWANEDGGLRGRRALYFRMHRQEGVAGPILLDQAGAGICRIMLPGAAALVAYRVERRRLGGWDVTLQSGVQVCQPKKSL